MEEERDLSGERVLPLFNHQQVPLYLRGFLTAIVIQFPQVKSIPPVSDSKCHILRNGGGSYFYK